MPKQLQHCQKAAAVTAFVVATAPLLSITPESNANDSHGPEIAMTSTEQATDKAPSLPGCVEAAAAVCTSGG